MPAPPAVPETATLALMASRERERPEHSGRSRSRLAISLQPPSRRSQSGLTPAAGAGITPPLSL
jgi:hypothetical protein